MNAAPAPTQPARPPIPHRRITTFENNPSVVENATNVRPPGPNASRSPNPSPSTSATTDTHSNCNSDTDADGYFYTRTDYSLSTIGDDRPYQGSQHTVQFHGAGKRH